MPLRHLRRGIGGGKRIGERVKVGVMEHWSIGVLVKQ